MPRLIILGRRTLIFAGRVSRCVCLCSFEQRKLSEADLIPHSQLDERDSMPRA
jgi:hypothetical protein